MCIFISKYANDATHKFSTGLHRFNNIHIVLRFNLKVYDFIYICKNYLNKHVHTSIFPQREIFISIQAKTI